MPTTIILSIIENYEEGFGGRAQIRRYNAAKKSETSKGNKTEVTTTNQSADARRRSTKH